MVCRSWRQLVAGLIFLLAQDVVFAAPGLRTPRRGETLELQGKVLACHDGDTCRVATKQGVVKVRFWGIDAPELRQSEGPIAKRHLESLIVGSEVRLLCSGRSYQRLTCEVFRNAENINQKMVADGMAFDSPKYSKGKFARQMKEAQSRGQGIWKTIKRSPACFRKKRSAPCKLDPLVQD